MTAKEHLSFRINNIIYDEQVSEIHFNLSDFERGKFVKLNNYFCGLIDDEIVIYDDICDHASGKLNLVSQCQAKCPIHGWTIDLASGLYSNGCTKEKIDYVKKNNMVTIFKKIPEFPHIDTVGLSSRKIDFYFNTHASVTVNIGNISLTTDPWLIGPACAGGWWHSYIPDDNALNRLANSNIIYISHNHSDHLHLETLLTAVDRGALIIIPNYESRSVENVLLENGYKNLLVIDFMSEVEVSWGREKIKLIIVKSGDERDDSSLLLFTEDKKIFFAVDTNRPNNWILPSCDILFTPFASGASCFPSCIDNFSDDEKIEISSKNKKTFLVNHVKKLIDATSPKYIVPYAGYFQEVGRDKYIKSVNIKNSIEDLSNFLSIYYPKTLLINPTKNNFFCLDEDLELSAAFKKPLYILDENYISKYLRDESKFIFTESYLYKIGDEFIESKYYDDLTIVLFFCNEMFEDISDLCISIDFSIKNRGYKVLKTTNVLHLYGDIAAKPGNNYEFIKIRRGVFMKEAAKGFSLEDLTSGWNMRIFRSPNVYNFKFYNYFTDVHKIMVDVN
jgi:CMP-N-acetylneuraminate monooxygenase